MASDKLTPKQERFCLEYVVDLNGTQAAIRAGYSEKTASVIANENLIKPYVQNRISELQKELQAKTGITAEKVIAELALLGFSNIQDYIGDDNEVVDLSQIDRNKAAAVDSIKTTVTVNKLGDTTTQVQFKLNSKQAALESLGRHLGIFEKDNKQKSDAVTQITRTILTKPVEHKPPVS